MAKIKLTFKKHKKETGLASVANPYAPTDIKVGGLVVGMIAPPHWSSADVLWRVRFAIKRPDNRFKWITMATKHTSEPEARVWVNIFMPKVIKKYELHSFEADR